MPPRHGQKFFYNSTFQAPAPNSRAYSTSSALSYATGRLFVLKAGVLIEGVVYKFKLEYPVGDDIIRSARGLCWSIRPSSRWALSICGFSWQRSVCIWSVWWNRAEEVNNQEESNKRHCRLEKPKNHDPLYFNLWTRYSAHGPGKKSDEHKQRVQQPGVVRAYSAKDAGRVSSAGQYSWWQGKLGEGRCSNVQVERLFGNQSRRGAQPLEKRTCEYDKEYIISKALRI